MTKKSKIRLVKDQVQELAEKSFAEAAAETANAPIDSSPILDSAILRNTIETVSALNLGDLAHEMTALNNEMPLLAESCIEHPLNMTNTGYLMAVAFETGRRYNMLQVFQLLSEEVETLPDKPVTNTTGNIFIN